MANNRPKRVYKGDEVALYLPEGFKPTEIGIKNLHRRYHSGSVVSELDLTEKVKKPKAKQGGLIQKVESQDVTNTRTAKRYTTATQGKDKPKGIDMSLERLCSLYNKTAKKPLTLAQFRTRAKRRTFQKTLKQLATHQFS